MPAKRVDPRKLAKARRAYDRATRAASVAERRYADDLRQLASEIGDTYARFLGPAIKKLAARPTADAIGGPKGPTGNVKADVAKLRKSLDPIVTLRVQEAFDRMHDAVADAATAYSDEIGITPISISKELAQVYEDASKANVDLVVNAQRDYADQVVDIFTNPDNFGRRVEDLADELKERSDVSESRAELIARDQTLKTLGALNEARQTGAGVEKYVWSTSRDNAVRGNPEGLYPKADPSHFAREGQVFSWDDPPEGGHPGEDINCRCAAVPLIDEAEGLFGGL